jgi:hypothetical protein
MKNILKILVSVVIALAGYIIIGMKVFYPFHRAVALICYLTGGIVLFWAIREKWKLSQKEQRILLKRISAYLPHIVLAVILVILTRVAWVLVPVEPTDLTSMSEIELRRDIQEDFKKLMVLKANIDAFLESTESSGLLSKDVRRSSVDERNQLRDLWYEYLMMMFEYDLLKNKYRGFYQIDYVARPELHADSFFIALNCLVNQYDSTLRFLDLIGSDTFLETILNEATDRYSANTLYNTKQQLTNPDILLQLSAGAGYLQLTKKDITAGSEDIDELEVQIKDIYAHLGREPKILLDNPLELLERCTFKGWFGIQKHVAEQMSRIRTTKRDYFIPVDALKKYKPKLEPGDIMLERRNWYMTNIGIPGFWPHVAFYIGSSDDMNEYFKGLEILKGKSAFEFFKERFPDACASLEERDGMGFTKNIIEALADGIVMTSFEKSGHCDYLAVIRPRISKEKKFRAIERAFSYWGRSYDYNFDFATDSSLVCSELVYKAFEDSDKFTIAPIMMNGRLLLPPNLLASKFDKEYGSIDSQLDFVLYLEGNEKKQTFSELSVDDFRKSWKYPKWDIMQK